MAKPDNRADNVEHLEQSIQNTKENMKEAENYLNEFSSEINGKERNQIEEKMHAAEKVYKVFKRRLKTNQLFPKSR